MVEKLEVKKPKRVGAFQGHYWLETEAPFSAILYWKRLKRALFNLKLYNIIVSYKVLKNEKI